MGGKLKELYDQHVQQEFIRRVNSLIQIEDVTMSDYSSYDDILTPDGQLKYELVFQAESEN